MIWSTCAVHRILKQAYEDHCMDEVLFSVTYACSRLFRLLACGSDNASADAASAYRHSPRHAAHRLRD